jgi:TorA maturation chaperone TorD
VKKIYQSLGLRLRHDQVELADHIAIEMEALACALATSENDSRAGLISDHLSIWFPVFSATLARESLLESYKRLAFLTMECISAIQSGSTEENSAL